MTVSRACVLVLGLHRSGTSAFSRIANILGCDLPSNLMGASEGNHYGHWESNVIVALNDELLASAGSHWDDWLPINTAWSASIIRENFLDRAIKVLNDEYGNSPLFVLKDPRICRLAPFWLEALKELNAQTVVAIPIRNPFEVSASLGARDGSQQGLGLLIWLRNVLEAERATRDVPRLIFSYEQILENWTAVTRKFEEKTGLVWPRQSLRSAEEIDGFIKADARHQRVDDDFALGYSSPEWIRRVYSIFLRWSRDGENPADHLELDTVLAELNAASPSFAQIIMQGTGAGEAVGHAERHRNELREEIKLLRKKLGERDEERDELLSLRDRIEVLVEERDKVLHSNSEMTVELENFRSERLVASADLDRAKDELGALRDEFTERESDLRRQLNAIQIDCQAAVRAGARSEGEAAVLRVQSTNFEARIDQLSSALRQREEEATQAWGKVAAEKQRGEALSMLIERLEASNKSLEGKINLLEDRLQARTQQYLISESEVFKARWEAKEATLHNNMVEKALKTSEAAFEKLRDEYDAVLAEVSHHESEIVQLNLRHEHQLEQATTKIAKANGVLSRRQWEVAELVRAVAQLERDLDEASALRNKANVPDDAMQRIDLQHEEMAKLARLAAEEVERVLDLKARMEWLGKLSEAEKGQPRWWVFLSRKQKAKRVTQRIERMGLFDSCSYYQNNEDVAESGIGALEHYIRHGIFEGRSW